MHRVLPFTLAILALGVGCSGGDSSTELIVEGIVVYSGRNEALIGPLLESFEESTGVEVRVRYGSTSEMTATLLEEGERTPADLFISQDAAALGALSNAGMLRNLEAAILARVPERFRSQDGNWIGLSGRSRVVVYNTEALEPGDLPQDLWEVGDPKYKGRFGLAPSNGSFQAHMAALRAVEGPARLAQWLEQAVENEAVTYPNNRSIVAAVLNGEIDWGLVNHYYLWRELAENPDLPGANFFMPSGDISGFINVAGAGLLSDNSAAEQLLEYLLSPDAQSYFSKETYEYPVVEGIEASVDLIPLDEMPTVDVSFAEVSAALEATLVAISASGLLP